jgi:RNA polymerase-interacting CarD/CdnL/TRCF family regulator
MSKVLMSKKIGAGDLLYHAVHGLCRVREVIRKKEANQEVVYYSLVPKVPGQMKFSLMIDGRGIEASGFHAPVTPKEANKILEYLKTASAAPVENRLEEIKEKNDRSFAEHNTTWALAKCILNCSRNEMQAKDQKRRQNLDRAAAGLVKELAFALKISVQDVVAKVQKSLEQHSKVHPLVITALQNSVEEIGV